MPMARWKQFGLQEYLLLTCKYASIGKRSRLTGRRIRIHAKQVLALYGAVLPFAVVDDLGWWSVPIVTLVIFTLYGIEGIGSQLEDPFGYDRNDIKMDAIAEDARIEATAMLEEWKRVSHLLDQNAEMFIDTRRIHIR